MSNWCGLSTTLIVAILVMVLFNESDCQTFQYSRGWTNGRKRAENPNLKMQSLHKSNAPDFMTKSVFPIAIKKLISKNKKRNNGKFWHFTDV